jgi:hypothetical protein
VVVKFLALYTIVLKTSLDNGVAKLLVDIQQVSDAIELGLIVDDAL